MHFFQPYPMSLLGGLACLVVLCTIMVVAQSSTPLHSNSSDCCGLVEQEADKLNDEIDRMKRRSDILHQYTESCSDYIKYQDANNIFTRVPIYPGLSRAIIANCKRVNTISNVANGAIFEVPFNSVEGRTLILRGTAGYDDFIVNFIKSSTEIFLHIRVKPRSSSIVRNNYNSGWGEEETGIQGYFPFTPGVQFMMEVTADDEGFHCRVDHLHKFTFRHRQRPLSALTSIKIIGVFINSASFN